MEVSHGCFQGGVEVFDNLRLVWADVAGYGTVDFSDEGGPVVPKISYNLYSEEDSLGEWPDGAPDDPLIILLVHVEHAGRIKVSHCPYVADRLESLEHIMMKAKMVPWVLFTQQFVRGLRTASHYNQDVVFS
jgi:hypothetical protein